MLLILLLSYTNRQSEVCSTRPCMRPFSSYYILSLKILLSSKTTHFMFNFLPFSILFWPHFLRAQNEFSPMLQSVKRRIFSSKNICVKVLATSRKMHNKMAQQRRFFANFKLKIFLVNQSYLDIPLAIQVKVSVIQKSILNCYITAHVARNRISLSGNRVKILKK